VFLLLPEEYLKRVARNGNPVPGHFFVATRQAGVSLSAIAAVIPACALRARLTGPAVRRHKKFIIIIFVFLSFIKKLSHNYYDHKYQHQTP